VKERLFLRGNVRSAASVAATFAPTLQKAIAMAYVEPASSAVGTQLAVDVRGKAEAARVVALPFYKRRKT